MQYRCARIGFHEHVSGYASQRRAQRPRCAIAPAAGGQRCTYWNGARECIRIGSCPATARGSDVNLLLSAGRAAHAAAALEGAAAGSVLVKSLAARSVDGARVLGGNDDVDTDRSVVIRLWPARAP